VTWPRVPLADVLEASIGGVWGEVPGADEMDVQVLRVTELRPHGDIDPSTAVLRSIPARQFETRRLQPGDLLLEKSGGGPNSPVGRVGLIQRLDRPSVCSNFMQLMRPGEKVLPRFLHLYLNLAYIRGDTIPLQKASTNIRNLKASEYLRLLVPLPPLVEQRRIVDILDDHLSRLDAAVRDTEASSRRLARLELSALRHARRTLLDEGAPLVPIGAFCTTALGKMLDAKRSSGESTPYLRNINVRWGSFDLTDVKSVPLTNEERERLRLTAGDLLVCEGGEPGRCAVWPGSQGLMTYQKALHRVRMIDTAVAVPHFVALMLEEVIRTGRADRLFTGTTIKHLPQEKLRTIAIPLPDVHAQHSVIARLDAVTAACERLVAQIRAIRRRNENLRCSLLAAAFSGGLAGGEGDINRAEEMAGV
jgi:type I restriction enzyme, S subunit